MRTDVRIRVLLLAWLFLLASGCARVERYRPVVVEAESSQNRTENSNTHLVWAP